MDHNRRAAWLRLTPSQRYTLSSHLPGELERAESMRASILSDLSDEFGPQQWDATLAVIAEGESDRFDTIPTCRTNYHGVPLPDGCTLEEVGREIGVTRERVRCIEAKAMRKLRRSAYALELLEEIVGERTCGTRRRPT